MWQISGPKKYWGCKFSACTKTRNSETKPPKRNHRNGRNERNDQNETTKTRASKTTVTTETKQPKRPKQNNWHEQNLRTATRDDDRRTEKDSWVFLLSWVGRGETTSGTQGAGNMISEEWLTINESSDFPSPSWYRENQQKCCKFISILRDQLSIWTLRARQYM